MSKSREPLKNDPTGTMDTPEDPLKPLEVFRRLEVGPVRLEPNRIAAPYRLFRGENEYRTELSYSYQEPVFDPEEPESRNLADMISAQVAINYGLFCSEIVFHGLFDRADQHFLRAAAENTAREIYVKKFLEPNPFLTGAPAFLPTVKRKSYLRSVLKFSEAEYRSDRRPWATSTERYAVLSSGGKDSLLTFGLMKELGHEVHPIFGNESGRHWFTALNAFRSLSREFPETTKVWMDSDRLFAWMLRHFPFVRQDFASVRSDEYPIRLWTVAVFLFGALPILRKRRLGRLLIGDEHDTTHRTAFKGIPHYDGLYDQSRYFDTFATRYFLQKGWGIQQFSILRPLSELLIQTILARRYPQLHANQVSCHAAHKEGERVRPCGKCEKCRRIVSMLVAVDADPSICGYRADDVQKCLQDFTVRGIHQEKIGVQHLQWLLGQKKLIDLPSRASERLKARPIVAGLRFDPERSPVDGIPVELRKPLYTILMEHAEGAALRKGKLWQSFDPFSTASLTRPYPFSSKSRTSELRGEQSFLLGTLTWPEAQRRFEEVDVALLPVGAVEQHGPHLPLDTDAFDADYTAREVARRCSRPRPLVLPLIPYGVSYHHEDFSGTLSITNNTLAQLVYEIGMGATRNGITKLVIINGHGGNSPALNFAAQMINRDAHIFVCVDTGESSDVDVYGMIDTPNDVHAGEIETSTTMALRPHLVKEALAEQSIPTFSSRYLNFTSHHGVSWYAYTRRISPSGVMGDPTRASAEKGRKIWEVTIKHLVEFVEELKRLTLEEIYQKRY